MNTAEQLRDLDPRTVGLGGDVRCTVVADSGLPPLFVEPTSSTLLDRGPFLHWFASNLEQFEAILLDIGAIVLRGFPIEETEDFESILAFLTPHSMGYAGGAALRKAIKGQVMESTRMDRSFRIPVHQEMSYLPNNPRIVAFFCKTPAETGGATTIANMRTVTASLPPQLLAKFADLGVRYTRNLLAPDITDERTDTIFGQTNWVANFGTDDRQAVEVACEQRSLRFEWLADGSLNLINQRPGVISHPTTGQDLYFTHVHAQAQHELVLGPDVYARVQEVYGTSHPHAFDATFGDGTPLTDTEMEAIHQAIDHASVSFPWQAGDVMFVENKFTAHGRQPFTGARDVQVALLD